MAKEHELEIEVDPYKVLDQCARAEAGEFHQYPELMEGFLGNIRLLARKGLEFSPGPG